MASSSSTTTTLAAGGKVVGSVSPSPQRSGASALPPGSGAAVLKGLPLFEIGKDFVLFPGRQITGCHRGLFGKAKR